MPDGRRANRGPGAAGANRRALVAAAVEVFGERGYAAPLSAVARRAGVGQGSLYRHFPERVDLALAVFADNVAALEALAARPGTTVDDLLALVTDQLIASVAFVEVVSSAPADPRLAAVTGRVRALLAGAAPAGGADDLLLAIGMVAALVARVPPADRRATADAAWALLRRGLRP